MKTKMPSKAIHILESVLIIIALVSLWPLLANYDAVWYRVWLVVVLGMMGWLAGRRLRRIRAASDEAKRIRDEMEKGGRPPMARASSGGLPQWKQIRSRPVEPSAEESGNE